MYTVITSDFIDVVITSSNSQHSSSERRFQKGISIREFKGKLELLTGGNPSTMSILVFNEKDHLICKLEDDDCLLGSYPIDNGMRIHVEDNFSNANEDLTQVEKFEISEEEYAKRADTLKAYLAKNKLGKYNDEEMAKRLEKQKKENEVEEALAHSLKIDNRCEISVPNQPKRRGTIMFVGKTDFKEGWWVGVKYDEPLGKNDGTVNGKKYFECLPKYGSFVKPAYVKMGDYPEEDFDLDEEL